jgi:ParB-like chromosome segregation protein Spo0J
MTQQKQRVAALEAKPQQAVSSRLTTIKLRELPDPGKEVDDFGHRFGAQYQPQNLEELTDSIRLNGLLDPPIVAKAESGIWQLIGGHRRVAALHVLVNREVAGFAPDMSICCLELVGASGLELVIRSIASNELARKLDPKERLLAVKKASAAGASKKQLAATVGVSEKSIDRDLRIVRHERVLRHVLDDDLQATSASALVAIAEEKGRLEEFVQYFAGWVERTKEQIEEEERRAKAKGRKPLRPNQAVVATRLEPHIVRGWLDALAKGRPLTEEPDPGFEADFDRATAVAIIHLKIDAKNDEPNRIARAAAQVSLIAKRLAAIVQTRRALEGPQGPQAALQDDESLLDTELLRQFGLDDLAGELDTEAAAGQTPTTEEGEAGDDEA